MIAELIDYKKKSSSHFRSHIYTEDTFFRGDELRLKQKDG
jgi:hypothetical protein